MYITRLKWTKRPKTDRNEQKQTKNDRNKQKQAEKDRI